MARIAGTVLMALLLALGLAQTGHAAIPGLPTEALCASETSQAERGYGIPSQLLDAISLVESGRYDRDSKATLAWPWTVTAEGRGKYLPTKAEAIAEVNRLKAKGVKNIDVGCMQINLQYHPKAFPSLEDAFEPAQNVGYAARFLKGLYDATGHWVTAASYYHSQTPSLAAAYRERLTKVLNAGGSRNAIASLSPVRPPHEFGGKPPLKREPQPTLTPRPASPQVEQMRQDYRQQQVSAQAEAREIAEAYRHARMAEYQLRRARMVEARRAYGLPADGY